MFSFVGGTGDTDDISATTKHTYIEGVLVFFTVYTLFILLMSNVVSLGYKLAGQNRYFFLVLFVTVVFFSHCIWDGVLYIHIMGAHEGGYT